MILGNKSEVKGHFPSKHSMFSHKIFVDDVPAKTMAQVRDEEQSAQQSSFPPGKVDKPNVIPLKS